MSKFDWLIITVLIGCCLIAFVLGATHPIKKEVVIEKEFVPINVTDSSFIKQCDSLYHVIDSLEISNEYLYEELSIATFKLERIRDYNEVAKKGNNIKYLRGWINRVLNE